MPARTKIAFICIVLSAMLPACATNPDNAFALYLVRHAEKTAVPGDPPLSAVGRQRSVRLAEGLADRHIGSIWSSDYARTRETAAALAKRLDLEVGIYDPRAQEDLANRLLADGQNALVVGHSNTIPELAALLCQCDATPIGESEYDRLFIIKVDGHGRRLSEFRQSEYFGSSAQP